VEEEKYLRLKAKMMLRNLHTRKNKPLFDEAAENINNAELLEMRNFDEHKLEDLGLQVRYYTSRVSSRWERLVTYERGRSTYVPLPLEGAHVLYTLEDKTYISHLDEEGNLKEEHPVGVNSPGEGVHVIILPKSKDKEEIVVFRFPSSRPT